MSAIAVDRDVRRVLDLLDAALNNDLDRTTELLVVMGPARSRDAALYLLLHVVEAIASGAHPVSPPEVFAQIRRAVEDRLVA